MDDLANHVLTPEGFWTRYKKAILENKPSLSLYKDNRSWTKWTKEAAELMIGTELGKLYSQGLSAVDPVDLSPEYFRIDITGSEKAGSKFDWHLRIAYEHENAYGMWEQEFCKLTHIIANLRVIIGYDDRYTDVAVMKGHLQEVVDRLEKGEDHRVSRLKQSEWLIAIGPTRKNYDANKALPFVAFKIVGAEVTTIDEGNDRRLIPGEWNG